MSNPLSLHDLKTALARTLGTGETDAPLKAAAVSAIFRKAERDLEVLLIRRAERTGDPWSGHMALPGGRRDSSDANLLATALRETREEVGLDLATRASLVGRLSDHDASHRARAGFVIRPFVFSATEATDLPFTPNDEVTEIVWAPVGPMIRGEIDTTIEVSFEDVRYTLPAFDVGGRTVWGLTYRILRDVFGHLESGNAARP